MRTLPLLGSIAALCLSVTSNTYAQDHTWISPASGVWSNSANWLGGVAPVAGGSPTLSIKFAPSFMNPTAVATTNDLAGNFLINALEFDVPVNSQPSISQLSVSTPSPNGLVFSGTNSHVTQNGSGSISIGATTFDAADGITTVDGTGSGNITFGNLSGLSTGDALRIAAGSRSPNGQIVSLGGNATGGTIQLDSGNLSLSPVSSGTTNFRINGGTVRVQSGPPVITIASSFELGASLVMLNPNNATITSAITSGVPTAGLQLRSIGTASTLTLTGASTYTGPTVVDRGSTSTSYADDGGTLRLNGNGSILNSSEIDIRSTGTLAIETSPTGLTNRLGDSTPVILRGGRLLVETLTASPGVQSEQIGPVSVSGFGSITVGTAGRSVDLTAPSLSRLDRGTILFRSPTLTNAGTTPARILFNTAPTLVGGGGAGPDISIIPYAIGDNTATSNGIGLVAYDPATGVRLLDNSTEYVSGLNLAPATSNVRLVGTATLSADKAINSLFLAQGATSVGGTSTFTTLTVSSGAILIALNSSTATATINAAINFGSAEGQIFTFNDTTMRGISGSGGLTKSGPGMLALQGNSTFTGPLTINNGKISFGTMANLGADTSAIMMSDNAGLRYPNPGSLTFNRPIQLLSGYASLEASFLTALLNVTQPISGPGGLRIGSSGNTGTVRLSGANTYEGPTIVSSGTLEFGSDSALGSGELWLDATAKLLAPWTTSRAVRVLGGTLNTGIFNATLNGELVGSDALTKLGMGNLTLTKSSNFSGDLNISEGTVTLTNQATIKSLMINASSSIGSLVLDETGTRGARLTPSATITLDSTILRMIGDASIASSEKINTLALAADTSNTLHLVRPGTASLSFTATNYNPSSSYLIVNADNLGGAAGSPNTRFILGNPPATNTGILPRIYALPDSGPGQQSLTKYDPSSDSAGVIGVKPLAADDYTSGPVLQHSAGTANFLVQPGTTAGGTNNFVKTLTFDPGGTLTQSSGQALVLGDQMLVRSGTPSSVTGGTLTVGTLMAFGDITLDTTVVGPMEKLGSGTLILGTQPGTESITIGDGPWRPLSPLALEKQTIAMDSRSAILRLAGGNASVGALSGIGAIDLDGGTVTVGVKGTDFTFSPNLLSGGQFVIVDGGNPNALRTLNLPFGPGSDSVTLQSGRLRYNDSTTISPKTLNLAGGVLDLTLSSTFRVPLNVTGNATVDGAGLVTLTSTAIISGPGSVSFTGENYVHLQSLSTHTGETIISGEDTQLILEGSGALTGTSAIRLNAGAGLQVIYSTSNAERIGNNSAIHIDGGGAYFEGPRDATVVEQTGSIFVHPAASLILKPEGSFPTSVMDLRPASFERVDGGILTIDAPTLAAIAQPKHVEIHPQTQPPMVGGGATSGPSTSIIPWIIGAPKTFVTSDPVVGLRMLDPATDYAQGLAAVTGPTNNLNLVGIQTLDAPLTVNSLRLADGVTFANLKGNGTLTIASGAVMATGTFSAIVETPIDFGSTEGIVMSYVSDLSFRGPISGSGGLTIAGPSSVTLGGTNSFTGPLRVNGGGLRFEQPESLGASTSPIRLDGTSLYYVGSGNATIARPIEITDEGANIGNNTSGTQLTVASNISGSGQLIVGGYDVLLSGNNSFTGGLRVSASGTVRFSNDAALGQGDITFSGGRLEPTFNWTSNHTIYPDSNAGISSGPFNVQLNGPLLGYGELRKYGTGTLTLRDADQFWGNVLVQEGTFAVDGDLPFHIPGGGDRVIGSIGSTLVGNGVWSRYVTVGDTLSPGPGIATWSVADTSFASDSKLQIQIASASSYDQLIVVGVLTLAPTVNLVLSLDYDPVDFVDSFTIVKPFALPLPGGPPQRFTYLGNELSEGETFFVGSQEFEISYVAGDGNDVTIYAVPEPSSALAVAVALCSLVSLRRRLPRASRC